MKKTDAIGVIGVLKCLKKEELASFETQHIALAP